MTDNDIYAVPRDVAFEDCRFYHTMEIPGHGLQVGAWDLRPGLEDYLGPVDYAGKRVLELGAADGGLTYHLEDMGAEVVAFDLSPEQAWDLVPYAALDNAARERDSKVSIGKYNNAWWFLHGLHGSRARMVHGAAYDVPAGIGAVDVAFFGAILLHLRDPFLALQSALRLTRETVVVTDMLPTHYRLGAPMRWFRRHLLPRLSFLPRSVVTHLGAEPVGFTPDPRTQFPLNGWWMLSPEAVQRMIGVLGFEDSTVHFHRQKFDGSHVEGRRVPYFTVVGRRTIPISDK